MKAILALFIIGSLLAACDKQESEAFNEVPDQSFREDFDTAGVSARRGWIFENRSEVMGSTTWSNPSPAPFPAFSGTAEGAYLWADYNSTSSAAGTISNWAISPVLTLQNGDLIRFYTRAELQYYLEDSTDFGNRMQVRISLLPDNPDPGMGTSPGNFNLLLLDINPEYFEFRYKPWLNRDPDVLRAYPHRWTRFEAEVKGLSSPQKGRFAFRYFVEQGGNNGRATSVGLDRVEYLGRRG